MNHSADGCRNGAFSIQDKIAYFQPLSQSQLQNGLCTVYTLCVYNRREEKRKISPLNGISHFFSLEKENRLRHLTTFFLSYLLFGIKSTFAK